MVRVKNSSGVGIHSHAAPPETKNILSSGEEVLAHSRHTIFLTNTEYYENHPFIMHFCSRGYFDSINRIIDHKFLNDNNGPREEQRLLRYLTQGPAWSNIPTRFFLLKVYLHLPQINIELSFPHLKSTSNIQLLKSIFLKSINSVVRFNGTDFSVIDQHFENSYHLLQKLRKMDLSTVVNMENYLKHDTQHGYIGELRRILVDKEMQQLRQALH